jgi:hypothetical protein
LIHGNGVVFRIARPRPCTAPAGCAREVASWEIGPRLPSPAVPSAGRLPGVNFRDRRLPGLIDPRPRGCPTSKLPPSGLGRLPVRSGPRDRSSHPRFGSAEILYPHEMAAAPVRIQLPQGRRVYLHVEEADVLTYSCDLLALKYAQALYGADKAVVEALRSSHQGSVRTFLALVILNSFSPRAQLVLHKSC